MREVKNDRHQLGHFKKARTPALFAVSQISRKSSLVCACIILASLLVPNVALSWPSKSDPKPLSSEKLDLASLGDGKHDATKALQALIDKYGANGGEINVPPGRYSIDVDTGLELHTGDHLNLDAKTFLIAQPSAKAKYALIRMYDIKAASVHGGNLVGERNAHMGESGEWGMGISILGSSQITISNISISDFWGDGIYIGSVTKHGIRKVSDNINLDSVRSINNRRQGLSITGCQTATISNSEFSSTNGTAPMSGIDLEPNLSDPVNNVVIKNTVTSGNAGYGIISSRRSTNVLITQCTANDNGRHGIYLAGATGVDLIKNHAVDNKAYDIFIDRNSRKYKLEGNITTAVSGFNPFRTERILIQPSSP